MSKGKASKNDVKNRIKATKFFFGSKEVTQAVMFWQSKKMVVMEDRASQEVIMENGMPLPWSMAKPASN